MLRFTSKRLLRLRQRLLQRGTSLICPLSRPQHIVRGGGGLKAAWIVNGEEVEMNQKDTTGNACQENILANFSTFSLLHISHLVMSLSWRYTRSCAILLFMRKLCPQPRRTSELISEHIFSATYPPNAWTAWNWRIKVRTVLCDVSGCEACELCEICCGGVIKGAMAAGGKLLQFPTLHDASRRE